MGNAVLVSNTQRLGNRHRKLEEALARHSLLGNQLVQRASLDVFHRDQMDAVHLLNRVNRDDVRVCQGCNGAGLEFEARQPLRIRGELRREHLDGDRPSQPRVPGQVHLAHPAGTQLLREGVGT